MEFEATIGLEIHAELKTATKMFCRSKNDADETRPNVNVCPVCLAHPGTLPVINREAVRHVLRVGTAIGGTLADYSEFDRKNYFYPDLPKGYQISQFEYPLVSRGTLAGVSITRIHLEEDTASSIHDEESGTTLIDYNRGGVPLMELVTDPVMHSAEEAGRFARELQLLLRYLGASEANMEKGEMRVEANVSVARKGEMSKAYVEIKNLNSFKTMEKAVEYEIRRQSKMLAEGGVLEKQTLGWDENKGCTFPQRSKEGSADYRYFPDPDLPSIRTSEIAELKRESLLASLPELPDTRRGRYVSAGIKSEDAEMYVRNTQLGDYADAVFTRLSDKTLVSLASNYIANDLANKLSDIGSREMPENGHISVSVDNFCTLIELAGSKKISSRAAKDILSQLWIKDQDPRKLAEERGLLAEVNADRLSSVVAEVIEANESVVSDYRAGKEAALEYLLGQCMKALRGAGDPVLLRSALREALGQA
jgi:aspartyl-tRNA(Asn)/glutamyl-tRNA(Gln) amidotransferase subunit B